MIVWAVDAMAADDAAIVLTEGLDADVAAARVRDDAGLDAAPPPTALSALVRGHPIVAIGASAESCTGDVVDADLIASGIRRARGKIDYLDPAGARAEVAATLKKLPCLSAPVDPTALARLYFIDGVAAHALADDPSAVASFAAMRGVASDVAWDTTLPPDAKVLFDAATPGPLVSTLHLVPANGEKVRVDGHPGGDVLSLPAGRHLIQPMSGSGAWVDLGPTDASVVVPVAVGDEAVGWIADDAGAHRLSTVLAAVVPSGTAVFVATPEGTWRGTAGEADWTLLKRHRAGLPVLGVVGMGAGAIAIAGGALGFAHEHHVGAAAWDAGDAHNPDATYADYIAQKPIYDAAKRGMVASGAIIGVGAAALTVGVVFTFGGGS